MSKTDQAYDVLRQDILSGVFKPNQALTISNLQQRYGLGWTPLRDALSRLEGARLVTVIRNCGYRVASVSHEEFLDLQRARLVVETELLLESIRRGDQAWQKRVLSSHRKLSKLPLLRSGMSEVSFSIWEEAHQAFHLDLLSGAPDIWLRRFVEQIYNQVRRHQRAIVMQPQLLTDPQAGEALSARLNSASAISHHSQLMDAALERDEKHAITLLREHIGATLDS